MISFKGSLQLNDLQISVFSDEETYGAMSQQWFYARIDLSGVQWFVVVLLAAHYSSHVP